MELIRDVDDRSIGVMEEDENGDYQYNALILFNFKILRLNNFLCVKNIWLNIFFSFISSPETKYRAYKCIIYNISGKDCEVFLKAEEVHSFKKVHSAAVKQCPGEMFFYKPFDESLWADLFIR